MEFAAAAASGLLCEMGKGAGFMWMGRGLKGVRGLLGPVVSLKGSLTKAVEVYGGYDMQMMRSDDNSILNMFARKFKTLSMPEKFNPSVGEQTWRSSVVVSSILFCACKCR